MSKQAKKAMGKVPSRNNRGGKSKYNKGGRKGSFDRDFSGNEYKSTSDTHNDVSWYTPDPQILNDVARLPYSIPTGMPISRPYVNQGNVGNDVAIPGILAQRIVPTLGYASQPNDPVNVAAQGIYSFVRHLNSGARNYDPVDLMIYIGAMDSVYSILSFATRLYATICSYSQGNRYLPRVLFTAQNADFDSFANNMAQFRAELNQRIAKASQLMVPKVMPIFERHRWLFANYYIEGDSMKDQIYLYAPEGFYQFTLDSDGAGMLTFNKFKTTITLPGLMAYIDSMLDPIIEDEDFNIMSGDIYKAYGGNIVQMGLIPDMITMNFTYDENVLLQFKNSKSKMVHVDSGTGEFYNGMFNIHQDTNKRYLIMDTPNDALVGYASAGAGFASVNASSSSSNKAKARAYALMWSKNKMLTSPRFDVTPQENMVNTRGTMVPEVGIGASGDADTYTFYFGSEWYTSFTCYTLFRRRSNGTMGLGNLLVEHVNIVNLYDNNSLLDKAGIIEMALEIGQTVSKFKYHPEIFIDLYMSNSNGDLYEGTPSTQSLFEVDNYTVIDYNVARHLHDAALLGEFNIPRIALQA